MRQVSCLYERDTDLLYYGECGGKRNLTAPTESSDPFSGTDDDADADPDGADDHVDTVAAATAAATSTTTAGHTQQATSKLLCDQLRCIEFNGVCVCKQGTNLREMLSEMMSEINHNQVPISKSPEINVVDYATTPEPTHDQCTCNKYGAFEHKCDPITKQCRCRPDVGGPRCDRCDAGFWGLHKISEGAIGCIGKSTLTSSHLFISLQTYASLN